MVGRCPSRYLLYISADRIRICHAMFDSVLKGWIRCRPRPTCSACGNFRYTTTVVATRPLAAVLSVSAFQRLEISWWVRSSYLRKYCVYIQESRPTTGKIIDPICTRSWLARRWQHLNVVDRSHSVTFCAVESVKGQRGR